jgi:hypothetical protein
LRCIIATTQLADGVALPSVARLQKAGFTRGQVAVWPGLSPILWLTHPSAQNMSPYARTETLFHTRMLDARAALRNAVQDVLGWKLPKTRPYPPQTGIYALPEWRELVGPHHQKLDDLWREKGV